MITPEDLNKRMYFGNESDNPAKDLPYKLIFGEVEEQEIINDTILGIKLKDGETIDATESYPKFRKATSLCSSFIKGKQYIAVRKVDQGMRFLTVTNSKIRLYGSSQLVDNALELMEKLGFLIMEKKRSKVFNFTTIRLLTPLGWNHIKVNETDAFSDNKGRLRIIINNNDCDIKFTNAMEFNAYVETEDTIPKKSNWTPSWFRVDCYTGGEKVNSIYVKIPISSRPFYLNDKEKFESELKVGFEQVIKTIYPDRFNPLLYWD